jgi:hypothetical protein
MELCCCHLLPRLSETRACRKLLVGCPTYIVSNLVILLSGYFVIPFGGPWVDMEDGLSFHSSIKIEAFMPGKMRIGITLLIVTAFLFSQP